MRPTLCYSESEVSVSIITITLILELELNIGSSVHWLHESGKKLYSLTFNCIIWWTKVNLSLVNVVGIRDINEKPTAWPGPKCLTSLPFLNGSYYLEEILSWWHPSLSSWVHVLQNQYQEAWLPVNLCLLFLYIFLHIACLIWCKFLPRFKSWASFALC